MVFLLKPRERKMISTETFSISGQTFELRHGQNDQGESVWTAHDRSGHVGSNYDPYGEFNTRELLVTWLMRRYGPQPDWRSGETWADKWAEKSFPRFYE